MRLSATLFKAFKIKITLVLALISFTWILELHQTEMDRKIELENLNVKLTNLINSSTHGQGANYKLWHCHWTGQYFIVRNFALHSLETVVTIDHPKTVQYSFDVRLSEYITWSVSLFEKEPHNQQDVYFRQAANPFIVPGKKLVLNFVFKEALNISTLVVKLGKDETGRPSIFRYKIAGEQTIEHILPNKGRTFEYDVPQEAFVQVSQMSCELEIHNSSAAKFLSIEGIGVYGLVKF